MLSFFAVFFGASSPDGLAEEPEMGFGELAASAEEPRVDDVPPLPGRIFDGL